MWQEPQNGDITVEEVLGFLRTSYQVQEAIAGAPIRVDWNGLATNTLLARLKDSDQFKDGKEDSSSDERDRDCRMRRCNSLDVKRKKQNTSEGSSRQSSLDKNPDRNVEKRLPDNRRGGPTRRRSSLTQKKDPSFDAGARTADRYIKRKLNQVLQEGILDSVLPYILSRHQQTTVKKPSHLPPVLPHTETGSSDDIKKTIDKTDRIPVPFPKKDGRRKSTTSLEGKLDKKDVEVVIHVCDEMKNMKKDFRCPQNLLISKMKYFAQVTAGQRIEDMDISVHCDVNIFDWLIRYVKQEGCPTLDTTIVIPVLMSSAFLEMDSLQDLCLEFCRAHVNEIIRDSSNLSCINDSVLTRLAHMFSNAEVEALKDRKDKLQSKLYCKLIMFLADPVPESRRGHHASIAFLFRCSKCGKLVSQQLSHQTTCVPRQIRMNQTGQLLSRHSRDTTFSLSDLVRQLKTDLKSWRRVYWRLFGLCHHLNCSVCASPFSVNLMSCCRYHLEPPQFFSMEHQRSMSFPVGRYPCCGERAFRYELLPSRTGCQERDHLPEIKNDHDRAILKIYKDHEELIRMDSEEVEIIAETRHFNSKEALAWEGLELAPLKIKQGLLGTWLDPIMKQPEKRSSGEKTTRAPIVPKIAPADISSSSESSDSDSSGSCGESEESFHATVRVTTKPRVIPSINSQPATRKDGGQVWVAKLSTRCNQDNLREFEERAARHIEKLLTRKTSGDCLTSGLRNSHHDPPGGTYVRLEAEWREAHCSSHGCPGSSKLRLNSINKPPKTKR